MSLCGRVYICVCIWACKCVCVYVRLGVSMCAFVPVPGMGGGVEAPWEQSWSPPSELVALK